MAPHRAYVYQEEEEEEEDSQPVKPMSYIKQQIAEEKEKRKMKKHLVDEAVCVVHQSRLCDACITDAVGDLGGGGLL